ncbi:hypothetical protein ES703_15287 [subsurface metagenome]
MNKKEVYKKLREIDKKTTQNTSIRLGMVTLSLMDKFCKPIGISRSRYIRIAISHFDSYLSQLNDSELAQEIQKIIHFD